MQWFSLRCPLLALASSLAVAVAWQATGEIPIGTESHFAIFAGKFCFDYDPTGEAAGFLEISINGSFSSGQVWGSECGLAGLYLLIYHDDEHSWDRVWRRWSSKAPTCSEYMKLAVEPIKIVPVTDTWRMNSHITQRLRPRFWYFTFCSCNTTAEMPLTYTIQARNLPPSFDSEFGVDERGMVTLEAAFASLFSLMAFSIFWRSRKYESLSSHPWLLLLLLSCACSAFGDMCLAAHNFDYAADGNGSDNAHSLGVFFVSMAKALLSSVQLVIARGRDLFEAEEQVRTRILWMSVLAVAVVISFYCEFYQRYVAPGDSSTALYLYGSKPGYCILLLNTALFAEVTRLMRRVYRNEDCVEVRRFYVKTYVASLVYFMSLPLICVLAQVLDPWVRRIIVARVELCARFLSTAILAYSISRAGSRLDTLVNARLKPSATRDRAVELVTRLAGDDVVAKVPLML